MHQKWSKMSFTMHFIIVFWWSLRRREKRRCQPLTALQAFWRLLSKSISSQNVLKTFLKLLLFPSFSLFFPMKKDELLFHRRVSGSAIPCSGKHSEPVETVALHKAKRGRCLKCRKFCEVFIKFWWLFKDFRRDFLLISFILTGFLRSDRLLLNFREWLESRFGSLEAMKRL